MTPDPAIATAADYADALLTARRAKNLLLLVVFLILLVQLAIFFTVYPIIDVPSPLVFASKIIAVTVIANATGVLIFALGKRRQKITPSANSTA